MADHVGQRLGNYTIVKLLGQGGFAEVYLGEHIYLKSQAAIKILQARLSSPDDMGSFQTEAQTIARLTHPNIVRVMDFGVENETPYLVMDYAPNGTLRERHAKGAPVGISAVVSYVKQMAAALQYAHDEHLIHRDIKPENMLIGKRGEILLSDFGIALVAQSSRYQGTQDVIGTVAYMSPEQIQGKPRPASDQYSLAIVVYEWLTGERPFHGSFTEMCTQHMFAPPPPISDKLTLISPDIERVVMKALEKDSRQRYETIMAFSQALEQAGGSALTTPLASNNAATTSNISYETVLMTENNQTIPSLTQKEAMPSTPPENQTGTNSANQTASAHLQNPSLPSATLHSSETVAQTTFDPGRAFAPPPQPAIPAHQPPGKNQFGPQRMILPATPQQATPNPPAANSQTAAYNQPQQPPYTSPPAYPNNQPAQQEASGHPGYQNPQQAQISQGHANQGQQFPNPATQPDADANRQLLQEQQRQQEQQRLQKQQYQQEQQRRLQEQQRRLQEQQRAASQSSAGSTEDEWGMLGAYKWHALATVVGLVLFCLFFAYRPTILTVTVPVILVVPLFFGASFGSIVGLIVGIGGVILAGLFFNGADGLHEPLFHALKGEYLWWIPYLMYAVAGGIPGLAVIFRKKLYPGISSAIRSSILAIIGFAATLGLIIYQVDTKGNGLRLFSSAGLAILISIAIGFIVLLIYAIAAKMIDPS